MQRDNKQPNLNIRDSVLTPILAQLSSKPELQKLVMKIYNIASDKSQTECPDTPISQIIYEMLPPILKPAELTHDEILQVVLSAKLHNTMQTGAEIELSPEFLFGDPRKPEYWVQKGKIILGNGFINNAIRCFEKAIRMNPSNVESILKKGECLFRLATTGSNSDTKIGRGLATCQSMLEEAMQCLEQVIQLDPNHARAWHNKGACFVELAKLDNDYSKLRQAMDCFRNSLDIDPSNKDAAIAIEQCRQFVK